MIELTDIGTATEEVGNLMGAARQALEELRYGEGSDSTRLERAASYLRGEESSIDLAEELEALAQLIEEEEEA